MVCILSAVLFLSKRNNSCTEIIEHSVMRLSTNTSTQILGGNNYGRDAFKQARYVRSLIVQSYFITLCYYISQCETETLRGNCNP